MILRTHLFRKVVIVGVGLIGGSLGLAMKKKRLAKEIIGLSQRSATLTAAVKAGAIDQGYQDVKKAAANADLVILATPVSAITGMLSMLEGAVRRNCIITDVGQHKAIHCGCRSDPSVISGHVHWGASVSRIRASGGAECSGRFF